MAANAFLDYRMEASLALTSIKDIHEGGCHDTLVSLNRKQAERCNRLAQEELRYMTEEATAAGKPVRFPICTGWAIVAEPA